MVWLYRLPTGLGRRFAPGRHVWSDDHVPLAVALITGTILFYGASTLRYHGYLWADQICLNVPALCAYPHWVGLAAMVVTIFYLYRQSLNS